MPHQPLRPPFRPRCLSSEKEGGGGGRHVGGPQEPLLQPAAPREARAPCILRTQACSGAGVWGLGLGGSRHPERSWHFESSPSTCPFLLTYLSFSVLVLSFKTMKSKRHSLGCT